MATQSRSCIASLWRCLSRWRQRLQAGASQQYINLLNSILCFVPCLWRAGAGPRLRLDVPPRPLARVLVHGAQLDDAAHRPGRCRRRRRRHRGKLQRWFGPELRQVVVLQPRRRDGRRCRRRRGRRRQRPLRRRRCSWNEYELVSKKRTRGCAPHKYVTASDSPL